MSVAGKPRSIFVDQLYAIDVAETRRRLALVMAASKAALIEHGPDRHLSAALSRVEADLLCAARQAVLDLAEALARHDDRCGAATEPEPEPPPKAAAPVRPARLPRLPSRTSP